MLIITHQSACVPGSFFEQQLLPTSITEQDKFRWVLIQRQWIGFLARIPPRDQLFQPWGEWPCYFTPSFSSCSLKKYLSSASHGRITAPPSMLLTYMLLFVFLTLLSYVILTLLCEHCARITNWTFALPAAVVILELELIPSPGFTVNKLLQICSFAEFAWCSWGNFRLHSWAVWLCLSRMLWLLARHRWRSLFHQGIWSVVQIVLFQACQG